VGVAVIRGDGPGDRERKRAGAAAEGGAADAMRGSGDDAGGRPPTTWFTGEQGTLFDAAEAPAEDVGYRQQTACAAADITYRQLDYWARTGLVSPSVRAAMGSGSQRLYSFRDILLLRVVKQLLDLGISLQQVRTAVAHLRQHVATNLAQVTLLSDGASVYALTSVDDDDAIDLLRGGQAVFSIVLAGVWRHVQGTLAALPPDGGDPGLAGGSGPAGDPDAPGGSSPASAGPVEPADSDELARRRARRTG
jgi:DNA-binding transcriptional MerR regulator